MAEKTKKKFELGPIQRDWVRALRSGKYKQCKSTLTKLEGSKKVGHCCLGVLCELALKKGVELETTPSEEQDDALQYEDEYIFLPAKVRKWAALRENDGDYAYDKDSLAGQNDSGTSFKKIADVIEENAALIFTRSV